MADVAELVRSGIDASLMDDVAKRRLAGEVDSAAAAADEGPGR